MIDLLPSIPPVWGWKRAKIAEIEDRDGYEGPKITGFIMCGGTRMRGLSSFEKRLAKLEPDTNEKSFAIPGSMFAESMRLIAETVPEGLEGKPSREVAEVIRLLG